MHGVLLSAIGSYCWVVRKDESLYPNWNGRLTVMTASESHLQHLLPGQLAILVVLRIQTVAEDVFIWTEGQQYSVNYGFNCDA